MINTVSFLALKEVDEAVDRACRADGIDVTQGRAVRANLAALTGEHRGDGLRYRAEYLVTAIDAGVSVGIWQVYSSSDDKDFALGLYDYLVEVNAAIPARVVDTQGEGGEEVLTPAMLGAGS